MLGQAKRDHGPLAAVQRRWRGLVGKALADHTKPVSLRRGRLVVHVAGPGDGHALSFQRRRLIERLRNVTDGKVDELVVRPGEL